MRCFGVCDPETAVVMFRDWKYRNTGVRLVGRGLGVVLGRDDIAVKWDGDLLGVLEIGVSVP